MKHADVHAIQTPRRMVFDWHGPADCEPSPGDYMRAIPSQRTWLVQSTRAVKVRVSRGETSRHSIEMVLWPDDVPEDSMVFKFHWNKREKRPARRLGS